MKDYIVLVHLVISGENLTEAETTAKELLLQVLPADKVRILGGNPTE